MTWVLVDRVFEGTGVVEDGGVVEGGVERVCPDGSDGRAVMRKWCLFFCCLLQLWS